MPEDVFEYTNLEVLSIRVLNLIPPEITKLKKLRKLTIAFWGGGALPDYISKLDKLEELRITVALVPLILPDTLIKLENLKVLSLYQCKLKEVPKVLLKIPQLVILEMAMNESLSLDLPDKCYWPNLEALDVGTNACEEIPTWIYQHKSLKKLFLMNNKIKELPTAIVHLTKLEKLRVEQNEIETVTTEITQLPHLNLFNWFGNPIGWISPFVFELKEDLLNFRQFSQTADKQYIKDLVSIRKALVKANLLENRMVVGTICTLLSKNEATKKNLSNAAVLDCYSVSNSKVRVAVITEISKRLAPFDELAFKKGSELLVLGKTIKKKVDLKTRLKELEIALVNKRTIKTSHVVLGKNIKKTEALLDTNLILLTETELNHYLDKAAPAYLLEAAEDSGSTDNLRMLLLTLSDENVSIALELLKSGGVPKDLMTTLFFVHKFSKNATVVRKSKNLLTLNASETLLESLKIRFNFKQNRVNFFNAEKYLKDICSKTEINKLELVKYASDHYCQKHPFLTLYTGAVQELPEKEQKAAAIEYWNNRVENGYLFLKEGDGRIINHLFELDIVEVLEGRYHPVTVLTSHLGGAKMKRLKKMILQYGRKRIRLPKDFGTLENLEELDFTNINFYEGNWQELQKLKNLKKLIYKSDETEIPAEIFDLRQLKILILEGKNIQLDLPIHQLQDLEEIEVVDSSLLGNQPFITALKSLPKLKKLQLHADLDALY